MNKKIIGLICLTVVMLITFISLGANASIFYRTTPEKEKLLEKSQVHQDIENNEAQKQTKEKVDKMLDDVLIDVISTYQINKKDYNIIGLKDLNNFINGNYDGFKDKSFLEQAAKVIVEGLENRPMGSTMPNIFVKMDCSEIMIAYKDAESNNILRQFSVNKEKNIWDKKESSIKGKQFEPIK